VCLPNNDQSQQVSNIYTRKLMKSAVKLVKYWSKNVKCTLWCK